MLFYFLRYGKKLFLKKKMSKKAFLLFEIRKETIFESH